jgi:GTP1/Obg family GTP-binding protein
MASESTIFLIDPQNKCGFRNDFIDNQIKLFLMVLQIISNETGKKAP